MWFPGEVNAAKYNNKTIKLCDAEHTQFVQHVLTTILQTDAQRMFFAERRSA
jgi:hypothetical protein